MTHDPRDDMASALSLLADALRGELETLAASGVHHIPRPRASSGKNPELTGVASATDTRGPPVDARSQQQSQAVALRNTSSPKTTAEQRGAQRATQASTPTSTPLTTGRPRTDVAKDDPVLIEIKKSGADAQAKLERLRLEAIGDCRRCKLHRGRTQVVFGAGAVNARLVFVGEGPGSEEDRQGVPFVGAAGQLLTRMIEAMSLRRDDVYICNVVKCRPPNNRDPERDEVAACEGFLKAQLDIIRPEVIVTLGRHATQTLLRSEVPISSLRGRWASYEGIPLLPTFHPAFLLRSPEKKREAWGDLQEVMRKLQLPS